METNVQFLNNAYKDIGGFNINTFQVRLSRDGGIWINCTELDLNHEEVNNIYHRSDFRPIPYKPFELGDYVCTRNKCTILKLASDNIVYFNGKNYYAQSTNMTHWKPDIGDDVIVKIELCKYDDGIYFSIPYTVILSVIEVYHNNEYMLSDYVVYNINDLIPYINGVR